MSLSADPSFTVGSTGNLIASTGLAANTSVSATFYIGVAGQSGAAGSITTGIALFGRLQIASTPGSTVAATNGLNVNVYSTSDGTNYDTIAYGVSSVIPSVASTVARMSWDLSPGQYKLTLQNLDTTNSLTAVVATLGTAG